MKFWDIESGEVITLERLESEYNYFQSWGREEYDYSFSEYVSNCLTAHNGTLEIL